MSKVRVERPQSPHLACHLALSANRCLWDKEVCKQPSLQAAPCLKFQICNQPSLQAALCQLQLPIESSKSRFGSKQPSLQSSKFISSPPFQVYKQSMFASSSLQAPALLFKGPSLFGSKQPALQSSKFASSPLSKVLNLHPSPPFQIFPICKQPPLKSPIF